MARRPQRPELTNLRRSEESARVPAPKRAARTQVPRAEKPKAAAPAGETAPARPGHGGQIAGSLLLLAGLWILLGLVLWVWRGEDHPFGPILGTAAMRLLVWLLGGLPALLLPLLLALSGIRLIAGPGRRFLDRATAAALAAWVHAGAFFSLPGVTDPDTSPMALSRRAGLLGQAFADGLLRPVFGTHWFGPALLLSFTLAASLALALRLAPRQALETAWAFLRSLLDQARDRRQAVRLSREEREAERALIEGGAMALGVEPKGRFLDRSVRPEPEDGVLPLPIPGAVPEPVAAPKARRGRTPLVPGAGLSVPAAAAATGIPEAEDALEGKALDVYRNLSEWRPLRPEDLVGLNPLEIRELKRRDEELRRAALLNEWEDRDVQAKVARRPRIPEPAPSPNEPLEASPREPSRSRSLPRAAIPEPEELPDEPAEAIDPPEPTRAPRPTPRRVVAAPPPPRSSRPAPTPDAAGRYRIPDVALLPDPPAPEHEVDEKALQSMAGSVELQLKNFGVQGRVLQIEPGPVITRFKIELAPGVPVRKIANLAEDLALALRARRIRIQAPIPGESFVGVEIPNARPETVHIKELLRAPQFRDPKAKLPVVLGKDTQGNPAFTDLSRAPHLLIAGQTGSGKSVCINTIMCSFLFSQSPERLRMILIDPKVVELSTYAEIPHLMSPVITKPEEAVQALKWTAVEMDRRYEVLAQAGVRNIAGFNDKFEAGTLPDTMVPEDAVRMPYLLLVVDEFADLMMVAGKEVETNVARIAQKARAVGIHMILATQRPSTNVITGVIKANLPTRIAFQVASQIDARTILDRQGAEDLLGRGDMLFRGIEAPEATRVHGAFVSDQEAEAAASAASSQGVVFPMIESFDMGDGDNGDGDGDDAPVKLDAKFGEAARLVAMTRQGSVSMLQRRLEIGFARAGRLMDQLERMGIVGRDRGSKAREVLMDELQVEDLVRRLEEGY